MKTALIVLFAVVAVAVGASVKFDRALERTLRDTDGYGSAARAASGADGQDAASMTVVVDELEGKAAVASASTTHGKVGSSSEMGTWIIHKD